MDLIVLRVNVRTTTIIVVVVSYTAVAQPFCLITWYTSLMPLFSNTASLNMLLVRVVVVVLVVLVVVLTLTL